MKLLLDQNLSPRLTQHLSDIFPDTAHVSTVGLERAPDSEVWAYARSNAYCILTKDADFSDVSVLLGAPPKLIWLRLGNCTTTEVEQTLRRAKAQIDAFEADPLASVLQLV